MSLSNILKARPTITIIAGNDVESSHTFSTHVASFQLSCNSLEDLRYSWESGGTAPGGNHVVLRSGLVKWEDLTLLGSSLTIYILVPGIASPADVDVALEEWQ